VYEKQRVVQMALPGSTEPRVSKLFKLLVWTYSPCLLVGMPFMISQPLADARDGMCPWLMHRRWRFMFPLHTALDTTISVLSLYLFVRPLWKLADRTPSAKAVAVRAIARRNAFASLIATFSTLCHTCGHWFFKVGRHPGYFWIIESQDVRAPASFPRAAPSRDA